MRPARLVRVCGAVVDVLLYVDVLPPRGGDVVAARRVIDPGGGCNVLFGAARLGLEAAYGGLLGDGPFAQRIAAALEAAGVAMLSAPVSGAENGLVLGLVEPDGERTFASSPGIEAQLELRHLALLPLRAGDTICVSGYDLCYPRSGASLAHWAPSLGTEHYLVFDPGPLAGHIPAERLAAVLTRADLASMNAREAELLTGHGDPAVAARAVAESLAPNAWAIIRTGGEGCWAASSEQEPVHIPARPARTADTTGAGDAHLAALLARLREGDGVIHAARCANIAASMAVEHEGPNTCPTAAEARRLDCTPRAR